MKFITPAQCRAARALLEWGQPELAKASGVHTQTISNFEKANGAPTKSTIEKIAETFERAGIEFLPGDGLRRRESVITCLEGTEGVRAFFDDVYETAKTHGGKISLFNSTPGLLIHWMGEEWFELHAARMAKIRDNVDFKVIIEEGNMAMIGHRYARYKWFPTESFNDKTIYCYGDKLGFFNVTEDRAQIMVMRQAEIAASFHVLFDIAWTHMAIEPPSQQPLKAAS